MTHRSAIHALAAAGLIVLTACSGSTDSPTVATGSGTATAPASTEAPDVPVTDPPATDPPPTDPPVTDPPVTDPPPTDPPPTDPPVTDPPAPVTSEPTASTTVVYVGNSAGGAWPALATWDGSTWQEADFDTEGDPITPPPSDFAAVSVASLGLDDPLTGLAAGADDFVCVDDRMGPTLALPVVVDEIPASSGYDVVAAAMDWDIVPRPITQVGLDAPEYQAVGESLTAAAGVDGSGGDVVQAIRADLDGDGTEEVLVTFEKITEGGFGTPGDFSIVFARYPTTAGDVVDSVIFEYYPQDSTDFPTIGDAGVIAIGDFNGDAVMEVVLRSAFWETGLADLYSFTEGELVGVTTAGCGL